MRRFTLALLATTTFIGLGQAASAADLPVKAPARVAPVVVPYNWNGFYIGAHIGGAFSEDNDGTIVTPAGLVFPAGSRFGIDRDSFIGGGQVGYNWQFHPNWLIGVEGDISGVANSDNTRTFATVGGGTATLTHDVNFFATATGRLGYVANEWLFYAKGGAAFMDFDSTVNFTAFPGPVTAHVSDTRTGWTVGGGIEWGFAPNWSAKIEYNFFDFSNDSDHDFVFPAGTVRIDTDDRFHVVKAGLNYRFVDFPFFGKGKAPVTARY